MYKVILFDLDGTLIDSGEGITKSVQYAIEKMGGGTRSLEELACFVGPPMRGQYQSYMGYSPEEAGRAVNFYRERYGLVGYSEAYVYPGMAQLLAELKEQGYRLGVATSKAQPFVDKVMKYFSLEQYFEVIVGSELDGRRSNKAEVVLEAIRRLGCRPEEAVLVGDRKFDLIGARQAGIDGIGVTYGYCEPGELEREQPAAIFTSVEELGHFFG